jgi:hypothetical protein
MDPINFLPLEILFITIPIAIIIYIVIQQKFNPINIVAICVCAAAIYTHTTRFKQNTKYIINKKDVIYDIILAIILGTIIIIIFKYKINKYSYFIIGIITGIIQYITFYFKENANDLKFTSLKLHIDVPITIASIFLAIVFYNKNVYISLTFFINSLYHIIEASVEGSKIITNREHNLVM